MGWVLVVAWLLVPTAWAADGSGAFLAEGELAFPAGSELAFTPLLLFHAGTEGVGRIHVSAPLLRVHVYEEPLYGATLGDLLGVSKGNNRETTVLHDATLRLDRRSGDGFVALYAAQGQTARLLSDAPFEVESRENSEASTDENGAGVSEDAHASDFAYRQAVQTPHLALAASGTLHHEGPLVMKIMGLDLRAEADEGSYAFQTGERAPRDPVDGGAIRWAIVEAESATVDIGTRTPWQVAAPDGVVQSEGLVTFVPLSGALKTEEAVYSPSRGPAALEGQFVTVLAPAAGGPGVLLTRASFEGDLSRTTLAAQALPLTARLASDPLGAGGLAVGLLVALSFAGLGFTTGALYGRRRARPAPAMAPSASMAALPAPIPVPPAVAMPFTAEDCCDAGAKAASEEDWAGAAKWFSRARVLAPTSARICADLAFSLSQIGDVDEALRLYAEASRLSDDGEADFNGALAALHGARPLAEIEAWLERALARSPGLVVPLDADEDFRILHGRPRYERAVREAWHQLDQRGFGGAYLA